MNVPFTIQELDKKMYSYSDVVSGGKSPYVKFYNHQNIKYLGMHMHEFYELNVILKGSGRHYIEDSSCPAVKGSVFVIPHNVRHGYFAEDGMDVFHILLSEAFMAKYSNNLEEIDGFSILFEIEPILRNTIEKQLYITLNNKQMDVFLSFINVIESNMITSDIIYIYTVLSIISFLSDIIKTNSRMDCSVNTPWFPQMIQTIEYIRKNSNKKINFKELAKNYHFSYMTYLRNFKKLCSVSPSTFQNECRVEKAMHMLKNGHSVLDTALECGYYDSSHFIRSLRASRGISPSDLQQAKFANEFSEH